MNTFVLPGQPLQQQQGSSSTNSAVPTSAPGRGTFHRDGQLYASLAGKVQRDGPTLSISGKSYSAQSAIPDVGSLVVGIITKITRSEATLNIHTVDQQPSRDFQGCIRAQDIRATEKDKVKVWLSFRPGDLVQARVLSLGDARSYFLSTAERHLGVLYAVSADGRPMQAVAWDTMRDTLTGDEERRKVAGPSP